MKKNRLAVASVAALLLVGLGGCAGTSTLQDNKAGLAGGLVTGLVVNAAGCGFNPFWCGVRTAVGAVAGWFGGKAIAGEK